MVLLSDLLFGRKIQQGPYPGWEDEGADCQHIFFYAYKEPNTAILTIWGNTYFNEIGQWCPECGNEWVEFKIREDSMSNLYSLVDGKEFNLLTDLKCRHCREMAWLKQTKITYLAENPEQYKKRLEYIDAETALREHRAERALQ
jgi:hypothetical protein